MERFPVFRSRDPEETRAFLDEKQFRFDMAPRQRPALGAQLNGVYLPSMYLGYIEYGGAAVATTATSGRSDYSIQIALRGNIEVAAGRDVIACAAAPDPIPRDRVHIPVFSRWLICAVRWFIAAAAAHAWMMSTHPLL